MSSKLRATKSRSQDRSINENVSARRLVSSSQFRFVAEKGDRSLQSMLVKRVHFASVVSDCRRASSMTCPTCEHGLSYDECQRKTKSYDCENVGNTFTMCKVECNKLQGNWEFGCATPTYCERQNHYCTRTKECNIACCEGSNCIQGNPNMTDPCRGSLTHAPKVIVVGACVLTGLYAMYRN